MDPELWKRVESIFHRAADLSPGARDALLDGECGDEPELRLALERLLRDDVRESQLLDQPGAPVDRPDPMVGRELGVYRLTSRIAAGGMGVVYEAARTDGLFDQEVAVKLIRAETATDDALRRFELERRTLATLTHPNIARLYDGGATDEGNPYLVMEFIHGVPIDRYCDRERLPVEGRLRLFAKVCRAVHFAHQNLIVHRDLKPPNILVDEHGEPKLLDFGIARFVQSDDDGSLERTRTIARVLTPEYASPEQFGGHSITTASDVYSLGVVLYSLLTGRRPFHCDSGSAAAWERVVMERAPTRPSTAVVRQAIDTFEDLPPTPEEHAEKRDTTPSKLRHRLSGDLDRIILMSLRKEPERRYASAQAFAEDLERHLAGQPVLAREDSVLYRTAKFVQRNRLVVAAAALIVLALVFGLVAARRGRRLAEEQAQHARIEARSFRSIADFVMDTFLAAGVLETADQRALAVRHVHLQAARVRREHADEAHLRANLLGALGRVLVELDELDPAEELIREAHDLRKAEFGEASLEVALSLAARGGLEYRRGAYDEAVGILRRALELHRTLPRGTHTDVATAANDLATALRNAGLGDEALDLHVEALALRIADGPGTLPVAESMNNLAGVHLDRGEYGRARELLTRATEIRRSILGPGHPLTLQSIANTAIASWHDGDPEEAGALLEEAERGFRELRADGRDGLARTLETLGMLDVLAGRSGVAEARLSEAFEIQVERLGAEHHAVASILAKLAQLQHGQGKDDEARETWQEALRIRRTNPSTPPQALGRTLQEYGVFLIETDDLEQAAEVLAQSVEVLGSAGLESTSLFGRAEITLGACLMRTDHLDDAEEHLRTGMAVLQRAAGVTEGELATARTYLETLEGRRAEDG